MINVHEDYVAKLGFKLTLTHLPFGTMCCSVKSANPAICIPACSVRISPQWHLETNTSLQITGGTAKHFFFHGIFLSLHFGLHGHFCSTFLRNSETGKIIFANLSCSDPQNVRALEKTRGEMIHRIYGASRFSDHDSVHDSFSLSFDTAQFTQV